ncbi:MAG: Hsp33 family molecular chaperone HslO [Bacilli bacterium]
MDKLVKAINSTKEYSIVACTTTHIMKQIVDNHKIVTGFSNNISDIVSANVLMSANLKDEKESISLNLNTNGMLSQIISNGNYSGKFNGYGILNDKPAKRIVGEGVLEVYRYYDSKELRSSQVAVSSTDISEIIVDYYFQSEQVYSVVLLASISDKKTDEFYGSGGILIQLLPNASEEVKESINEALKKIEGLSKQIALGMSAEEMVKLIDASAHILESKDIEFKCDCTRESVLDSVKVLDYDEIMKIIEEDGGLKVVCNSCNKSYVFQKEDFDE